MLEKIISLALTSPDFQNIPSVYTGNDSPGLYLLLLGVGALIAIICFLYILSCNKGTN